MILNNLYLQIAKDKKNMLKVMDKGDDDTLFIEMSCQFIQLIVISVFFYLSTEMGQQRPLLLHVAMVNWRTPKSDILMKRYLTY